MTLDPEGQAPYVSRPESPWALLRWPIMAALLALGVAVATPRASPSEAAAQAVPTASLERSECSTQPLALPPGHPPIAGMPGADLRLRLPPGHPPIDGLVAGARPPFPVFSGPETVDL